MNAPRLQVDADQLGRFYDVLFRHADDDSFISLRVFDEDDKATAPLKVRGCRILNGCRAAVLQDIVAAASFAANHPRRAVFAPPVVLLSNPRTAAEADIACGVALTVELDREPDEARRYLEALLGPATAVVASGGTWTDPETGEVQDRLHVHWRLSEPTRTPEVHACLKLARQLACLLVGADGSAVPLVHPLRWPGSWHRKGEPKLARLLVERQDAELELADALERLNEACEARGLGRQGQVKGHNHAADVAGREVLPDECLAQAAEVIPNAGRDDGSGLRWIDWNDVGMRFWAASGGSEAGFAAFDSFSAKSGLYDAATTRARWQGITRSPPTRYTASALISLAQDYDPEFPDPRKDPPADVDFSELLNKLAGASSGTGTTGTGAAATPRRDWKFAERGAERFIGQPPARKWLVEGSIPLGVPALIASLGGVGKSFLTLQLCLRVVLAPLGNLDFTRPIFGGRIAAHGSAVFLTSEDDDEEVWRRLHSLDPDNRRANHPGKLVVIALPSEPKGGTQFFIKSPSGRPVATADWESFCDACAAVPDLKLVVIDPLAAFAALALDADSTDASFVTTQFGRLAARTGATVLACHHMNKETEILLKPPQKPASASEAAPASWMGCGAHTHSGRPQRTMESGSASCSTSRTRRPGWPWARWSRPTDRTRVKSLPTFAPSKGFCWTGRLS